MDYNQEYLVTSTELRHSNLMHFIAGGVAVFATMVLGLTMLYLSGALEFVNY